MFDSYFDLLAELYTPEISMRVALYKHDFRCYNKHKLNIPPWNSRC